MNPRLHFPTILLVILFILTPVLTQAKTLYKLDFSTQKNSDAAGWFKENGFVLKNDADKVKARFENGLLVLKTDDDINGLFAKSVHIDDAAIVRIEWGVKQYPQGANWEKGLLREAIALIVSFGDKKISSGSFVIPNVPYFIGIFLGQHETEGKAYLGNYFKKGGRYFCSPCGSGLGQMVVTEFNLAETFKKQFGKSTVPFISTFSFEIDTRDTDGNSEVFIKSVSFISP